jgi:hypothetical protein
LAILGVWDLLDQDHDVRHGCGSSSSMRPESGQFYHVLRNDHHITRR